MAAKVIAGLRVLVAGVFLAAGVMKIWDFQRGLSATPDFTLAIQSYHLLPSPDLAVLLAVYLPWVEVTAALALFVRRVALGTSAALLGLTVVFLGAIGSAWSRGLDLACGCFGREEITTDYRTLILRDLALLAACAVLFLSEWRRATAAGASTVSASPAVEARSDRG